MRHHAQALARAHSSQTHTQVYELTLVCWRHSSFPFVPNLSQFPHQHGVGQRAKVSGSPSCAPISTAVALALWRLGSSAQLLLEGTLVYQASVGYLVCSRQIKDSNAKSSTCLDAPLAAAAFTEELSMKTSTRRLWKTWP